MIKPLHMSILITLVISSILVGVFSAQTPTTPPADTAPIKVACDKGWCWPLDVTDFSLYPKFTNGDLANITMKDGKVEIVQKQTAAESKAQADLTKAQADLQNAQWAKLEAERGQGLTCAQPNLKSLMDFLNSIPPGGLVKVGYQGADGKYYPLSEADLKK